ncbi:MAG: glycosyltransferase family 4 protein, partial [Candidatus Omnitrophota bacterium]
VPDKGIETFLACAQKMRDNKNLVFMIGGDGELRKDFERQVQEAGMQEKIIFTGHLDDTTPYFNMFDIFCLPTLREGFG